MKGKIAQFIIRYQNSYIKRVRVCTASGQSDIDFLFIGQVSIIDAVVLCSWVLVSSNRDDVKVLEDCKVILLAIRKGDLEQWKSTRVIIHPFERWKTSSKS